MVRKPIVSNVNIFGLEDSIKASKYPFSVNVDDCTDAITASVQRIGTSPTGQGHDNFLQGIVVQFDLTLSNKAWVEAERYHFLDFVSSQSTIHCISKFDIKDQCNEYVTQETIDNINKLKENYLADKTQENYLKLLYNIPAGFQITARMTTNYRQLKTIYQQRCYHRLPEWRAFCQWIRTLPYFDDIALPLMNTEVNTCQ